MKIIEFTMKGIMEAASRRNVEHVERFNSKYHISRYELYLCHSAVDNFYYYLLNRLAWK